MIFKLLPVCLLIFGCSQPKQVEEVQPKQFEVRRSNNTSTSLYGSFNFRDNFDYDLLEYSYNSFSYIFETSPRGLVNLNWSLNDIAWNLSQIDISYDSMLTNTVVITFYINNGGGATTQNVTFAYGDVLEDVDNEYADVIFTFNEPMYLHGDSAKTFNAFFTKEDNVYTTTYTGYYNFNNGLTSTNGYITVYGNLTFNERLFKGFTNEPNPVLGNYSQLLFIGYNQESDVYSYYPYDLPFDNTKVVSANILMQGAKMTLSTYNRMSNIGVFNYVRDTSYDDTDFEDLLFTVADTPVYFISQFLSFELFGMNLFVALSGLITLIVVIFIIRKIA